MTKRIIRTVVSNLLDQHDAWNCDGCGICKQIEELGKMLLKSKNGEARYLLKKQNTFKRYRNKKDLRKAISCNMSKVDEMIVTGVEYKGFVVIVEGMMN